MEVSIIILTKNAGDKFRSLVGKIRSQRFEKELEVVIVDSGSTDGTLEVAEKLNTSIHRIKPGEFHHAETRNLGARLANGRYLVYLTQDAIPLDNKWLENIVAPLESEEGDIVYGRQVAYEDAKPMDKFFYDYFYPKKKLTITRKNVSNPKRFWLENIFISDVNVAMKSEVWREISFSEDVTFAEDKDFAVRALDKGFRIIYQPAAAVYHSHEYSVPSLFKRRFKDGFALSKITSGSKTDGSGQSFIARGLWYWGREVNFLLKNGYAKWLPYALLYDFVFFIAFGFGGIAFKLSINLPGRERKT